MEDGISAGAVCYLIDHKTLMQWFSLSQRVGACLQGRGKSSDTVPQNHITLEWHRGLVTSCCSSLSGVRERLSTTHAAETLKIVIMTHFQFSSCKQEVDCDHDFDGLCMLGGPAEAGTGFSTLLVGCHSEWCMAVSPVSNLQSYVTLEIVSLPSPYSAP